MKSGALHIVRVGIAITFLWIGILILRQPEAWGSFLQPWAQNLLMTPLKETMIATAILDIIIGILLLIDFLTWIAALLASIHLAIVLITTGITVTTVRDIGLFAGSFALFIENLPGKYRFWEK